MIVWVDAQLSPQLASWVTEFTGIEARPVRALGLQGAKDRAIYQAARQAGAVVMTKDSDFLLLSQEQGPPPHILWITCGNTSNTFLRGLLRQTLSKALTLLRQGEPIVEISAASPRSTR